MVSGCGDEARPHGVEQHGQKSILVDAEIRGPEVKRSDVKVPAR